MKSYLYSVKDKVAHEFGPPFIAKNDGIAYRMFDKLISDEKVRQSDFELYCLAVFESDTDDVGHYGITLHDRLSCRVERPVMDVMNEGI